MALKKFVYPLDLSGERVSNRVPENHTIGDENYRAFGLAHGPFFTKGLTVTEVSTGRVLERGLDFECVYFYDEISQLTAGLEVAGVIVVHNKTISTEILVEAQFVGGPFTTYAKGIEDAIANMGTGSVLISWEDILDKPELFKPDAHLHDLGELFGFEFVVDVLGAIRDSVMFVDNKQFESLNTRISELEQSILAKIKAHEDNVDNPHEVAADDINTYSKEAVDGLFLDVSEQFDSVNGKFKPIADSMLLLDQRISGLVEVLNANSLNINTVGSNFSRHDQMISDINEAIDGLNQSLSMVNSEVEQLHTRDEEITQTMNALSQTLTEEVARGQSRDGRLSSIESEIARLWDAVNAK